MEGLKTLEFLIAASPDKRRLSSLTELATLGPESERAGYSQVGEGHGLPLLGGGGGGGGDCGLPLFYMYMYMYM